MGEKGKKGTKEAEESIPQYPSIYDIDLTIDICIYLFKTLRRQERQPIRFLNIVNTAIRRTILVRTHILKRVKLLQHSLSSIPAILNSRKQINKLLKKQQNELADLVDITTKRKLQNIQHNTTR